MKSKEGEFVPRTLDELKELFKQRNHQYKDTYKEGGPILESIFGGMDISGEDDWGRIAILLQIIGKIVRYKNNFHNIYSGVDRKEFDQIEDSLKDIIVYTAILMELDDEAKDNIPF